MSAPDGSAVEVVRLTAALGAEVRGMSLANPVDDAIEAIERLLLEHQVLFFPGQSLTIDQHVELGRRFGELEAHPNLSNAYLEHPEVFELAASKGGIADEWHTDLTFREHPSKMSILHMVKLPEIGGDTMWTNLCLAYDELSAPLQDLCNGLTALHDATPHGHPEQTWVHPVVRVHPETGRRALYVNEHFTRRIVELSHAESESLLGFLTSWVKQERFTVRYRWSAGTFVFWDNRVTQHVVMNDFVGERLIQRVTISGDKPEGDGPRWPRFTSRKGALSRHDRQLVKHFRDAESSSV